MTSVTVLACGFSTISERRQQERLVLASEEQGKHCVWGAAAAGGRENRGSVKRERCSAGRCTRSLCSFGRREPCPPQPALRVLLGQALCPHGVSLLSSAARGTEAPDAVQAKPSSALTSSAFNTRRVRCCRGIALNCLLFLLIYQKTLPRYLQVQQKCLLFLDLTSVLSSCKLQEGCATQSVHYLLKRLFIIAVPS